MPVLAFSLPGVFIGLAGVMLLLAMAALWQSLRTAFGGGPPEALGQGTALGERVALIAEKRTLLRAIKDIQFEREVGKISDDDFVRLDKAYRRRAKEVLKLLDEDLGEFLSQAERLVADAMGEEKADAHRSSRAKRGRAKKSRSKGRAKKTPARETFDCPSCGADNDVDATFCKKCATRIAPLECVACGTSNDPDAKFCKGCAKPLGDEGKAGSAEATAGGALAAAPSAPDDKKTEAAAPDGSADGGAASEEEE